MPISAYPLTWPQGWPRSARQRKGKFGKKQNLTNEAHTANWQTLRPITINEAVRRVRTELKRFGASDDDFVISTNLTLRLDGLPRADQRRPADPGVAIYWTSKDRTKPLVMAIDLYEDVADNLCAVAATLEAMRQIDRHGGAVVLERAFSGFTALPPPPSCWDVLELDPARKPDRLAIDSAFRRKALTAHPDRGGSEAEFQRITEARIEALRIAEEEWLCA